MLLTVLYFTSLCSTSPRAGRGPENLGTLDSGLRRNDVGRSNQQYCPHGMDPRRGYRYFPGSGLYFHNPARIAEDRNAEMIQNQNAAVHPNLSVSIPLNTPAIPAPM